MLLVTTLGTPKAKPGSVRDTGCTSPTANLGGLRLAHSSHPEVLGALEAGRLPESIYLPCQLAAISGASVDSLRPELTGSSNRGLVGRGSASTCIPRCSGKAIPSIELKDCNRSARAVTPRMPVTGRRGSFWTTCPSRGGSHFLDPILRVGCAILDVNHALWP